MYFCYSFSEFLSLNVLAIVVIAYVSALEVCLYSRILYSYIQTRRELEIGEVVVDIRERLRLEWYEYVSRIWEHLKRYSIGGVEGKKENVK